jgi:hypothetical protein
LSRIFGPKREEVVECWRILLNKKIHNSYASSSIIRVIKSRRVRWAGHVACIGEMRNAYRILFCKPEGKRFIGKPSHKCEDDIRTALRERGWEGVDWIRLAQDRDQWQAVLNTVMNLWVP